MTLSESLCPHPQIERAEWGSLNGPWRFCYDDERVHNHPTTLVEWPHTIVVPFPPESSASGIYDRSFHHVCWYQREFELQRRDEGRVILRFGAID